MVFDLFELPGIRIKWNGMDAFRLVAFKGVSS
jgi:hypothetical protein